MMYDKFCDIHDVDKHERIRETILKFKSRSFGKIFTKEKSELLKSTTENQRHLNSFSKNKFPAQSSRESKFKGKGYLLFMNGRCHSKKIELKKYYEEENRILEEERKRREKLEKERLLVKEAAGSGKFIDKFRKSLFRLKTKGLLYVGGKKRKDFKSKFARRLQSK